MDVGFIWINFSLKKSSFHFSPGQKQKYFFGNWHDKHWHDTDFFKASMEIGDTPNWLKLIL